MIERKTQNIAIAIERKRNLTVDDLKKLNLPLQFQGQLVIIEKSLNNIRLKNPLSVELGKILATGEIGLADYIIHSCLNKYPNMIPYIFEHQSMVKMSRHFLRHCSGSYESCPVYALRLKKFADWLGYSPDLIIQDVKPVGAIPDPMKMQNHCGFLSDYLAALQDSDLKPGAVSNYIKAVKTFYRTNGVKKIELDEPLSRNVSHKDRAPKPEELSIMLDKAAIRESFVIAGIATGGFREGTFSKLKYRHVKDDLEAGQIPIHIHIEANITKGKYHDYDTFLNAEASHFLKLYLDQRRQGTQGMPPEIITDESPLIRNSHHADRVLGVSEKTIRKIVHDSAVEAKVAKKLPNSWMYSVRTHSLRKFFRTQLSSTKIDDEIIKYMMGKTIDTYEDVQSLGIETLRNLYAAAGLAIRPKTKVNRIEQLKEIIRAWGENPEEILSKDILFCSNQTVQTDEQIHSHQLSVLATELKQIIRKEVTEK